MPGAYEKKFAHPITLSVLMPVYNERFLVEAAIRRVLAFQHPMVRGLELIVVDDGSTDGTRAILRGLLPEQPRMRLIEQPANRGKGAAIRRAIQAATGEISVIQDADLEYWPEDWGRLLRPFFELEADAVYGSRFLSTEVHRVLYFRHTMGNRLLTLLSNLMTDLNLTDMETCYKMVRTELLKSIPIRSDDFSIEPEITAKLAKRGAAIYEVPVRYAGRTYQEGKKITARHGWGALGSILKWKLIDDIFHEDEFGSAARGSLNHVHRFSRWTAEVIADQVGSSVLELGAGMGSLTINLLPRTRYLATDLSPHHLSLLHNLSLGRPYLEVQRLDPLDEAAFRGLREQFDTVLCLNVLQHLEDPLAALRNLRHALRPGGRVIVLVPQGRWLRSTLDEVLAHSRRYERAELEALLAQAGFAVQKAIDFNKAAVPAWILNGKLLRRQRFPAIQLKAFNTLTGAMQHLDPVLPWPGLSVILVAARLER